MINRVAALTLLCLTACGRTDLIDPPLPAPPAPSTPAPGPAPVAEYARVVFKGPDCPTTGEERDLLPDAGEQLTVVRFRAVEECSGAGGDWLLADDIFLGEHACWFFSDELRAGGPQLRYGLARTEPSPQLITMEAGWCLTHADGGVLTGNQRTLAWGIYSSEAAASAARVRLLGR